MTFGAHIYKMALNHRRLSPFMNHYRQSTSLLLSFVKHHSSSVASAINEQSFTESYLVKTCGFSPESALSIARNVKFKTADRPDSVLSCLRGNGFSEAQLSHLVSKRPSLLLFDAEKILSPKLEFFLSRGVSRSELARVFSNYPYILTRSLDNHIIPVYDFFRGLLKSDEMFSRVFVCCPLVIHTFEHYVKPNINHLYDNGVPESKIVTLVLTWPESLPIKTQRFNEIVGFVKERGFNPSKSSFITAISAVAAMSKPTWEKKVRLFKSWGWSEEDLLVAFKKRPRCMTTSESKINDVMGFFINEIGCEPSYIAKHPMLLAHSLEQRIKPRCSVVKVLLSKGMVKLTCLSSMLTVSDVVFEEMLVRRFKETASQLLKLYQEQLKFQNNLFSRKAV